jgi:hypothetical protein
MMREETIDMAASRMAVGKTKTGHRAGAKNAPATPARKATPARTRAPSADEAKHRLFSEKVRKFRQEAEELVASADRLLARLS